jgi:REP element-mobilizing transposase RayT
MSVHTRVHTTGIYFISFTCHRWLPLIDLSDGYAAVYHFFESLRSKGHTITGYVIMPNHLHFLLHYFAQQETLNTLIANGKRFMAYGIIKGLRRNNANAILHVLAQDVLPADRAKGQKHVVWINSFDVKECRTEKFLMQKLTYIHLNPVRGKWRLAPTSVDYIHSSALFYFNGRQQLFSVRDYRELINWEDMYP